jgi:hypothetical protein
MAAQASRRQASDLSGPVRLRNQRVRRLCSQEVAAARLHDAADDRIRAQLPSLESMTGRVRNYEASDYLPCDLSVLVTSASIGRSRSRSRSTGRAHG